MLILTTCRIVCCYFIPGCFTFLKQVIEAVEIIVEAVDISSYTGIVYFQIISHTFVH